MIGKEDFLNSWHVGKITLSISLDGDEILNSDFNSMELDYKSAGSVSSFLKKDIELNFGKLICYCPRIINDEINIFHYFLEKEMVLMTYREHSIDELKSIYNKIKRLKCLL